MTKSELLKLLILLARYVETYNESASDNDMNTLSDAYTVVQNKLLGCVDRTMTPVELFDIVDAQCKVVQEGADVKALEKDNARLDEENTHLLSEVAKWKRNFHHADDMLSEAAAKLDRIKAELAEAERKLHSPAYSISTEIQIFDDL